MLSIVIPSHNRHDLLRACLTSVTRFAPPRTETIVVDDGSVNAVVSATAKEFAGVRVVRLAERRGFCVAANKGIAAATRSVVEMLNDDTEVSEGWADAALKHFDDLKVAAVAPLVLVWPGDPPVIDSAGDRYYLGGVAAKRGRGQLLCPEYLTPCRVFGASASSAFYRREMVQRVGGFPESFGAYFEDVDLSFRLNRVGGVVMYEPTSQVLHHVSASHGPPSGPLLEQQSHNEERVFWRNVPAREMPSALPQHLAVLAGKAWRRWREGSLRPFFRGRLSLLREVADLLRHRRDLAALGPNHSDEMLLVERRFWTGL